MSDKKASNQMWGGRFASGPAAIMEAINASIGFDKKLYAQDIRGSVAHSEMLAETGIISAGDHRKIAHGLNTILREIEAGKFAFSTRARRHPHERRGAARRADRPGRRPPAHGALAQRPGGDRLPPLGARRARSRLDAGAARG
jgi:hypothetical protein